jgi:hypothetical protein
MSMQWETEVLPVLEAVHAVIARKPMPTYGAEHREIDAELGREEWDANTAFALRRLADAGYLRVVLDTDSHFGPHSVDLTERGLQLTSGWPAGTGDALLGSLLAEVERRIATSSGDERGALERFRDFATGVGRDVLVSVLSAYADRVVRGERL